MGRILAIDYGKKRTGLAVSDPLQLIAGALETVSTALLNTYLDNYLKQEQVDCVVVGLPKKLDNTPSDSMRYVAPFVEGLKKRHPELKVCYFDERFTSVLAHQTILQSGLGKKDRQDKARVDSISATILLQDYMESIRMKL